MSVNLNTWKEQVYGKGSGFDQKRVELIEEAKRRFKNALALYENTNYDDIGKIAKQMKDVANKGELLSTLLKENPDRSPVYTSFEMEYMLKAEENGFDWRKYASTYKDENNFEVNIYTHEELAEMFFEVEEYILCKDFTLFENDKEELSEFEAPEQEALEDKEFDMDIER